MGQSPPRPEPIDRSKSGEHIVPKQSGNILTNKYMELIYEYQQYNCHKNKILNDRYQITTGPSYILDPNKSILTMDVIDMDKIITDIKSHNDQIKNVVMTQSKYWLVIDFAEPQSTGDPITNFDAYAKSEQLIWDLITNSHMDEESNPKVDENTRCNVILKSIKSMGCSNLYMCDDNIRKNDLSKYIKKLVEHLKIYRNDTGYNNKYNCILLNNIYIENIDDDTFDAISEILFHVLKQGGTLLIPRNTANIIKAKKRQICIKYFGDDSIEDHNMKKHPISNKKASIYKITKKKESSDGTCIIS